MRPHRALPILAIALTSCLDGEPVDLSVRVTIPAEVRSITGGTLHLRVWSYDPHIFDGGATISDHVIARFEHRAGRRTAVVMRSSSRIDRGHEYFVRIEGCEPTIEGDVMVLWDGYPEEPRPQVTMEPIPFPGPCILVQGDIPGFLPVPTGAAGVASRR